MVHLKPLTETTYKSTEVSFNYGRELVLTPVLIG